VVIRFHAHAAERMAERGATSEEVSATVAQGEQFAARFGRTGFRRNFPFEGEWRGRGYRTTQIEAYAIEASGWLAITVIVRYFSGSYWMRLTYDPRYNIAYLRLRNKGADVETIRLSNQLNVDIAPDGSVYGIELLNANEQLSGEDNGTLVVVNEASLDRSEITLQIKP